MAGYIITLPENFASSTFAYVGYIFSDLSLYITILISVLVGALILEVLVGAIRKH